LIFFFFPFFFNFFIKKKTQNLDLSPFTWFCNFLFNKKIIKKSIVVRNISYFFIISSKVKTLSFPCNFDNKRSPTLFIALFLFTSRKVWEYIKSLFGIALRNIIFIYRKSFKKEKSFLSFFQNTILKFSREKKDEDAGSSI
jgi:hypothetical protein